MPNLVLEYNGHTYRFGLTTDAALTNGQNIKVPFNGSELYTRIGDDNTPLKVIKTGARILYSIIRLHLIIFM